MNPNKKLKISLPENNLPAPSLKAPRPAISSIPPSMNSNWSNSSEQEEQNDKFHHALVGNINSIHNPNVASCVQYNAADIAQYELTEDVFPDGEYDQFKLDIGEMEFLKNDDPPTQVKPDITQAFLLNMNLYQRAKYLQAESVIDMGGETNVYYKQYLGTYAKIRQLIPAAYHPSLKEITINAMLYSDVTFQYNVVGMLPGEKHDTTNVGLSICGYPPVSIVSFYDMAPVPNGILQYAPDREPIRRFRSLYRSAAKGLVLLFRHLTKSTSEVPWYHVHKLVMIATGIAERNLHRTQVETNDTRKEFMTDIHNGLKLIAISNGTDIYINPLVLREQVAKVMLKYS